jgi:hypothetical protein
MKQHSMSMGRACSTHWEKRNACRILEYGFVLAVSNVDTSIV